MNNPLFWIVLVLGAIVGIILLLMKSGQYWSKLGTTTITKPKKGWWESMRKTWYPVVSIVMILVAWYLGDSHSFNRVAFTKPFMVGIFLLIGAYVIVGLRTDFEKSFFRKALNFGITIAAIILVCWSILPNNWRNPASASGPAGQVGHNQQQTRQIHIQPNKWSEWIYLPPGVTFSVSTPGSHEYEFWNGERRKSGGQQKPLWFGTIQNQSFRLRGDAGEAIITYN